MLGTSTLIVTAGNEVPGESYEMTRRRVLRKLKAMADVAKQEGVTLCLEPLNVHDDHPGYWLTTMAQAADLVEEVGLESLKILYDIYHQQITEGSILANLRKHAAHIGHVHVAGAPGRGNLAGGDLDYRTIFAAIDAVGYGGYVGLEFRPTGNTASALAEAVMLAQTA
jgi:hydroxypyruvate isomerase